MTDVMSKADRSKLMSLIRGKDTTPEMKVRSALHRLGLRFRLHRKDLPGCPDIVLPCHKAVVLVHGCFWHRHANCKIASVPKSNVEYWEAKFNHNISRDIQVRTSLQELGWRVFIVWECEIKKKGDFDETMHRLVQDIKATTGRGSCF